MELMKNIPFHYILNDPRITSFILFFIYLFTDTSNEGSLVSDPTLLSIRASCSFLFGIEEALLYDKVMLTTLK